MNEKRRIPRFGDLAIELGYLDREKLDIILGRQREFTNRMLGKICVEKEYMTSAQVARVLASQYGCDFVDLNKAVNAELLPLFPVSFMVKNKFVPYTKDGDVLYIAMSVPDDFLNVADVVEMIADMDVSLVVVSEDQISAFLKHIESSPGMVKVSDEMLLPVVRDAENGEHVLSEDSISGEESEVVKLINSILFDAIRRKASDVHIETAEGGMFIRWRIDGMLHLAVDPLDSIFQSPVISRVKVMAELDIAEKRIPQDGRFKVKVLGRYIDFRVSILPTIFGEDAVIRILDRESASDVGEFRLDDMKIPGFELDRLKRMIKAPYGMMLMTGPTGSGKTTTLYRALSEVNSRDVKIVTIEDPVEYQLKGITQIPVNEKKGLTFAKGLRSILRHDPDKILVGEIRDAETAQIAIQSALTGHLVFTTVHANSSMDVLNRFMHIGIEPYTLMTALNCIIAQRLIRVLCSCSRKVVFSENELRDFGLDPEKYGGREFYEPVGCSRCNGTGYAGRQAIVEMVELDDEMRELFIKRAPLSTIKKKALDCGTVFLKDAAINEALSGRTSLSEAARVTFF